MVWMGQCLIVPLWLTMCVHVCLCVAVERMFLLHWFAQVKTRTLRTGWRGDDESLVSFT